MCSIQIHACADSASPRVTCACSLALPHAVQKRTGPRDGAGSGLQRCGWRGPGGPDERSRSSLRPMRREVGRRTRRTDSNASVGLWELKGRPGALTAGETGRVLTGVLTARTLQMNCKERLHALGAPLSGLSVFPCSTDGPAAGRCLCLVSQHEGLAPLLPRLSAHQVDACWLLSPRGRSYSQSTLTFWAQESSRS